MSSVGFVEESLFVLAADGRIGERTSFIPHQGPIGPNAKRQEKPHPHSVTISPDNRFAFVADLGLDRVLAYKLDPAAGTIEVFPQEITRVFLNLVSNGFYAVTNRLRENGGTVFEPTLRASTKSLGETVEIRIRDNGIGIPSEVKEKMFNPFFTTKPAGEGTGLGLSMSHDIIVKQHGGSIDVESVPGAFTEFTIVLPRTNSLQSRKVGQS